MNRSRWLSVLLTVSVILNCVLVYRIIDRGVTLTYQADERDRIERQRNVLAQLLMAYLSGDSKSGLVEKAKSLNIDMFEKDAQTIVVGQVVFHLSGAEITEIRMD